MTRVRQDRRGTAKAWLRSGLVALLALNSSGAAHAAEYLLEPGDIVEFAVVGLPDMQQKATIDLAGDVTLPMIGAIRAAGLPLREVRGKVQAQMTQKILRQRGTDGREIAIAIDADRVTLSVVEHRPIYIDGDVSKPGEQPYRTSMTVRQAVAVAGGYDVARFRTTNPYLQAPDLESEYRTIVADYARQHVRILRLEAEMTLTGDAPLWTAPDVTIDPKILFDAQRIEMESFNARTTDRKKEKDFLTLAVAQTDAQMSALQQQRVREEEGVEADSKDVERLSGLFDKGNLIITRVTEARRSLLLSSTRLLQTTVQIERARRDREDYLFRRARIDGLLRLEVSRDLQDARAVFAGLRSRLDAASEKLVYTTALRSKLARGLGARPEIAIVRKTELGYERIVCAQDAELRPGDVVEISLAADFSPKLEADARNLQAERIP